MNTIPTVFGAISSALAVVLVAIIFRPHPRRPEPADRLDWAITERINRTITRVRSARRQKQAVPPEDVANWCDHLARAMRSGSTLREALTSVAPPGAMSGAISDVQLSLERGQPIATTLQESLDPRLEHGSKHSGPHVGLAFSVIAIAARLGGSNATALDRAASSLRLLAADRQERVAHAAQARLSARVLTVVPLAMLALLVLTDADVRAILQAPIGLTCIVVGLVLNTAGWRWMRHIIGAYQ